MKTKEYLKIRQRIGSTDERVLADLAMHLLVHLEFEAENQRRIFNHGESEMIRQAIRLADQMVSARVACSTTG